MAKDQKERQRAQSSRRISSVCAVSQSPNPPISTSERRDSSAVDGGPQETLPPPAPSVVTSSAPTGVPRPSVQRPPRGPSNNPSGVPLFPAYGSGHDEYDPLHFDDETQKMERNFLAAFRDVGSMASDRFSVGQENPPGGVEQPSYAFDERQAEFQDYADDELEGGRRQSPVPQPQGDQGVPAPRDKTSSQRIGRQAPRVVPTPRDRRPRGASPDGLAASIENFISAVATDDDTIPLDAGRKDSCRNRTSGRRR